MIWEKDELNHQIMIQFIPVSKGPANAEGGERGEGDEIWTETQPPTTIISLNELHRFPHSIDNPA